MAINEMDARLISQGTQVESVGAEALVPVASGEGQPQSNITLANLADSLGKAVPQQQDAEQVTITGLYAQTSDGKMVELTKESVASVMAGLMGIKILGEIQDANLAVVTGSYKLSPKSTNTPNGTTYGDVLTVVLWDTNTVYQQIKAVNGCTYSRYLAGGTWKHWVAGVFGANTKEELASMVAGLMNTNKLFPFMYSSDAAKDLNTVTGSGFYRLAGAYTNSPITGLYGTLVVFKDMTSYVTQIVFSLIGTTRVFVRGGVFSENAWEAWKEISLL